MILPSSGVSTSQKFEDFPRIFRAKKTRPLPFRKERGTLKVFKGQRIFEASV